jgi:hypothetical protein
MSSTIALTNSQLSKVDKFLFAISKALLGSIQINFPTFGATNFAHLPVPHPKSNPVESLVIYSHGKIEKYSSKSSCNSLGGKSDWSNLDHSSPNPSTVF